MEGIWEIGRICGYRACELEVDGDAKVGRLKLNT